MFSYIEVEKTDQLFQWVEILCEDEVNEEPTRLRLVITDVDLMVANFRRRYQGKHQVQVNFSDSLLGQLNTFFQDFVHTKKNVEQGQDAGEIGKVAKTNVLNIKQPEKSTLKKSLSTRINMFLEEAYVFVDERDFERAYRRLDWVHLINPKNEMAFELKMVLLRTQERFGECITVLEKWIESCPDRLEAHLGLGELWLYLDQNQKALDVFVGLLSFCNNNCMAQIGKAQAEVKLGKDYISSLMKASVWNPQYTKDMIEHSFDFRTTRPKDLVAMTLESVSGHFKIPLKRMIGRALNGVLPFHRSEFNSLLLFSESELKDYYKVLKSLGLEMNTADLSDQPLPKEAQPVQMSLFEDYVSDKDAAGNTD